MELGSVTEMGKEGKEEKEGKAAGPNGAVYAAGNDKPPAEDDDALIAAGEQPLQGLGRQFFASFAVALGSMLIGFSSAFTSPALVSMAESNGTFTVTVQQGSWIGSLMPLSALVGGSVGGYFIEHFGRKSTILYTAPPSALAWLLITLAMNVPMVYAARIVSGFCVGVTSLCLPLYMGEITQADVRGMLGLLSTTLGNIGILLCFVLGKFLSWRYLALTGGIICVPYAACTYFAPETPRWYLSKGRRKEAEAALRWLRGGADVTAELAAIEAGAGPDAAAGLGPAPGGDASTIPVPVSKSGNSLRALFSSAYRRPVCIALGLMLFQQFSGINAVIFYTVRIFKDAGSSVDEFVSTMVVGAVNLAAVVLATALIDRAGRKVLLYISAAAMALSLAKLGTYFYLLEQAEVDMSAFGWLPLLSFVVFVVGFSLGFGPIPWLMMGEILPVHVRGAAASLATGVNWASTFVVTKTFADVAAGLGSHVAFWGFGIVCAGALVFTALCVPETRGRSLEDIERRFAGDSAAAKERAAARARARRRAAAARRRSVSKTMGSVLDWTASAASLKPTPTGV